METKQIKVCAVAKEPKMYNDVMTRGFRGPGEKEWYSIPGKDKEDVNRWFNPDMIAYGNTVDIYLDDITKSVVEVKLVSKAQKEFKKQGGWKNDTVNMTHDELDKAMEKSIEVVLKTFGIDVKTVKWADELDRMKDTNINTIINSLFIAKTRSSHNGG